jgi:hypothetical protein
MWKNIPLGECVDECVLLSGECVNHCTVFTLEKDCVEKHCEWEEGECRRRCSDVVSESDCEADTSCFWLKKNGEVPDGQCIGKVYINNYLQVTTTPFIMNCTFFFVFICFMFIYLFIHFW